MKEYNPKERLTTYIVWISVQIILLITPLAVGYYEQYEQSKREISPKLAKFAQQAAIERQNAIAEEIQAEQNAAARERQRRETKQVEQPKPINSSKPIKPSFDCAKAGTPTERAICSDADLAELDLRLNKLYKPLAAQLRDSQREWFKKRDQCGGSIECLEREYNERIIFLEQQTEY
jgi:uncharacterized protein YecT (DUF1311 family)